MAEFSHTNIDMAPLFKTMKFLSPLKSNLNEIKNLPIDLIKKQENEYIFQRNE